MSSRIEIHTLSGRCTIIPVGVKGIKHTVGYLTIIETVQRIFKEGYFEECEGYTRHYPAHQIAYIDVCEEGDNKTDE